MKIKYGHASCFFHNFGPCSDEEILSHYVLCWLICWVNDLSMAMEEAGMNCLKTHINSSCDNTCNDLIGCWQKHVE